MSEGAAAPAEACPWCGSTEHSQLQCHRLKAVDFHPVTRAIVRVEFVTEHDKMPPASGKPAATSEAEPDYPRYKPAAG